MIVRKRLRHRIGDWYATIAVAIGYLAIVIIAYIVLPGINDVPQLVLDGVTGAVGEAGVTFPPVVLWRFRIASLAVQAVTWATIAIGFGFLATRVLEQDSSRAAPGDARRLTPAATMATF